MKKGLGEELGEGCEGHGLEVKAREMQDILSLAHRWAKGLGYKGLFINLRSATYFHHKALMLHYF